MNRKTIYSIMPLRSCLSIFVSKKRCKRKPRSQFCDLCAAERRKISQFAYDHYLSVIDGGHQHTRLCSRLPYPKNQLHAKETMRKSNQRKKDSKRRKKRWRRGRKMALPMWNMRSCDLFNRFNGKSMGLRIYRIIHSSHGVQIRTTKTKTIHTTVKRHCKFTV